MPDKVNTPNLARVKHTPGPWHVWGEADLHENNIEDLVIVASQVGGDEQTDDNSLYICNIGAPLAPIAEHAGGIGLANARLIAASPELYDALDEMLFAFGVGAGFKRQTKAIQQARAALARAQSGGEKGSRKAGETD